MWLTLGLINYLQSRSSYDTFATGYKLDTDDLVILSTVSVNSHAVLKPDELFMLDAKTEERRPQSSKVVLISHGAVPDSPSRLMGYR